MNSFVDQKDYLRSNKNMPPSMRGANERKSSSSNNKKNNNNKYLPPNKRNGSKNNGSKNNVDNNTFKNDNKYFPLLTSSSGSKDKNTNSMKTPNVNVDFASLFKKKEKKVCDVKRGWVKISRVNNKSVFKSGNKTRKYYIRKTDKIDEDKKQSVIVNATFNNLVERWQNDRDEMNEVMEDWSPYWNEKDLREPLSDNEYESSDTEDDCDSYYNDYDDYDDYFLEGDNL
jgi:hypothetical protein